MKMNVAKTKWKNQVSSCKNAQRLSILMLPFSLFKAKRVIIKHKHPFDFQQPNLRGGNLIKAHKYFWTRQAKQRRVDYKKGGFVLNLMNMELQNCPNPDQVSVINLSLQLSFEFNTVSYVDKL